MGLAKILQHKLRMLREDAAAVARVVEEAFQGHSELDDELLDTPTRQLFYDLEDAKVLQVRRSEFVDDGRTLRAYTWTVRPGDEAPADTKKSTPSSIYDRLGADAWNRKSDFRDQRI